MLNADNSPVDLVRAVFNAELQADQMDMHEYAENAQAAAAAVLEALAEQLDVSDSDTIGPTRLRILAEQVRGLSVTCRSGGKHHIAVVDVSDPAKAGSTAN